MLINLSKTNFNCRRNPEMDITRTAVIKTESLPINVSSGSSFVDPCLVRIDGLKCNLCTDSVTDASLMAEHMKQKHAQTEVDQQNTSVSHTVTSSDKGKGKRNSFICQICQKSFPTRQSKKKHTGKVHNKAKQSLLLIKQEGDTFQSVDKTTDQQDSGKDGSVTDFFKANLLSEYHQAQSLRLGAQATKASSMSQSIEGKSEIECSSTESSRVQGVGVEETSPDSGVKTELICSDDEDADDMIHQMDKFIFENQRKQSNFHECQVNFQEQEDRHMFSNLDVGEIVNQNQQTKQAITAKTSYSSSNSSTVNTGNVNAAQKQKVIIIPQGFSTFKTSLRATIPPVTLNRNIVQPVQSTNPLVQAFLPASSASKLCHSSVVASNTITPMVKVEFQNSSNQETNSQDRDQLQDDIVQPITTHHTNLKEEIEDQNHFSVFSDLGYKDQLSQKHVSNKLALKTVSSVQSHAFLKEKLLHRTLRCAYCFNFQFKDWDHMQHHISEFHSDLIHTGYVIEKDQLKLVKHKNVEPTQIVSDSNSLFLSTQIGLEKTEEVQSDKRSISPLETKKPGGLKENSNQSGKILNSKPCTVKPRRRSLKIQHSTFDKNCSETNQVETLQCYYCPGEVFTSWALLKGHSYKCHISPLWNVDFKRRVTRKVQQSEHNYGIALPNTGAKCDFCDKSFQGKPLLDIHIQHHHFEEQKNIPNSR